MGGGRWAVDTLTDNLGQVAPSRGLCKGFPLRRMKYCDGSAPAVICPTFGESRNVRWQEVPKIGRIRFVLGTFAGLSSECR